MGVEERSLWGFGRQPGQHHRTTGSGEGRDRDCRDEEASVKEKGRRGKEEMEERWKSGRREWWQGPRMRWN